jgi:hypothetical protein
VVLLLLLVSPRPERRGGLSLGLIAGRHTNRPTIVGAKNSCIAHPDRPGTQKGSRHIVGYYAVVAGVEVDGLRRRPNVRTSQNAVKVNFAEFLFHALG